MITIIHGSHRHGYCWKLACTLQAQLLAKNISVTMIDLSAVHINYCCGSQVCQETKCTYNDDPFTKEFSECIIHAKGILVITPTYFNMPPARLKNFIDRSNALLPILEDLNTHPFFGAYVCGVADEDSIKTNLNLLKNYASIMGWNNIEQLNIVECLSDEATIDCKKVKAIIDIVYNTLHTRGE